MRYIFIGILIAAVLFAACGGQSESSAETVPPRESAVRLRVATTTSLYDTGLWSYLEPMFEEEYAVELDVLYAGTGKALEWGRRGDVDVITVHSPHIFFNFQLNFTVTELFNVSFAKGNY